MLIPHQPRWHRFPGVVLPYMCSIVVPHFTSHHGFSSERALPECSHVRIPPVLRLEPRTPVCRQWVHRRSTSLRQIARGAIKSFQLFALLSLIWVIEPRGRRSESRTGSREEFAVRHKHVYGHRSPHGAKKGLFLRPTQFC